MDKEMTTQISYLGVIIIQRSLAGCFPAIKTESWRLLDVSIAIEVLKS